MALPTTRSEFSETCLRKLGKGAIKINVTDEQISDRIDFALRKFADYHFDGMHYTFFKKQVTETDKTNKYIELPENVLGAVDIFLLSSAFYGGDIFNAQYQFVLNNIWEWQSGSLIPYFMAFQHLQLIEQLLIGMKPVRYNRFMNRLYIDMSWDAVNVGQYILVKCYEVVDPETYNRVWADTWLQEYATALIKQVWGNNLKKYGQMPLAGGVVMNGQAIYDEATQEIKELEEQVANHPIPFLMG